MIKKTKRKWVLKQNSKQSEKIAFKTKPQKQGLNRTWKTGKKKKKKSQEKTMKMKNNERDKKQNR